MDGGLTKSAIQMASEQHFFWFQRAISALEEMRDLAYDMSSQHTGAFAVAKSRFDEARGRCKVEAEILQKALERKIDLSPIQRLVEGGGEGGSTDYLDEETNE